MAKHRVEEPKSGLKARSALLLGSAAIGSAAFIAGEANATPVNVPGIGVIDIPGVSQDQLPEALQPKNVAKKTKPAAANKVTKTKKNLKKFGASRPASARTTTNNVGSRIAAVAMSKIGSPYGYGSAGPNAFDCSGLVYWAHQQVGKNIPRDSYGQLGGGTAVASGDLRPGDVVIYNGGSHAGVYVGNGMIVHSSNYGTPVGLMPVFSWDFYGARRY